MLTKFKSRYQDFEFKYYNGTCELKVFQPLCNF